MNMFQKNNKTPKTDVNEMKINDSPKKEFKNNSHKDAPW